jgi:hypothetical protein
VTLGFGVGVTVGAAVGLAVVVGSATLGVGLAAGVVDATGVDGADSMGAVVVSGVGDGVGVGTGLATTAGSWVGLATTAGSLLVCAFHAMPPPIAPSTTTPITTPVHGALFLGASVVCAPNVSLFGDGGKYGSTLSFERMGTSGMGAVS